MDCSWKSMAIDKSLTWIASLTLQVYRCVSWSINFTPFQSSWWLVLLACSETVELFTTTALWHLLQSPWFNPTSTSGPSWSSLSLLPALYKQRSDIQMMYYWCHRHLFAQAYYQKFHYPKWVFKLLKRDDSLQINKGNDQELNESSWNGSLSC